MYVRRQRNSKTASKLNHLTESINDHQPAHTSAGELERRIPLLDTSNGYTADTAEQRRAQEQQSALLEATNIRAEPLRLQLNINEQAQQVDKSLPGDVAGVYGSATASRSIESLPLYPPPVTEAPPLYPPPNTPPQPLREEQNQQTQGAAVVMKVVAEAAGIEEVITSNTKMPQPALLDKEEGGGGEEEEQHQDTHCVEGLVDAEEAEKAASAASEIVKRIVVSLETTANGTEKESGVQAEVSVSTPLAAATPPPASPRASFDASRQWRDISPAGVLFESAIAMKTPPREISAFESLELDAAGVTVGVVPDRETGFTDFKTWGGDPSIVEQRSARHTMQAHISGNIMHQWLFALVRSLVILAYVAIVLIKQFAFCQATMR